MRDSCGSPIARSAATIPKAIPFSSMERSRANTKITVPGWSRSHRKPSIKPARARLSARVWWNCPYRIYILYWQSLDALGILLPRASGAENRARRPSTKPGTNTMDFELNAAQRELSQRAWAAGLPWRSHVKAWGAEDQCPYEDVKQSIAAAGLLGLTMPKRYGGQGLTALDYVLVIENLFRSSQSWIVGEPTFCSSGPGPSLILLSENERTREKFLPEIISGRLVCAIALTEPKHGSDLGALETSAVLVGDHYVVNLSKRFIT